MALLDSGYIMTSQDARLGDHFSHVSLYIKEAARLVRRVLISGESNQIIFLN